MTLRKYMVIALLLAVVFPSFLSAQFAEGYDNGLETIKASDIEEYISYLADDSMKGRAAGTDEGLLAALYIADKFKEAGLKPLCPTRRYSSDEDEDIEVSVDNAEKFYEYLQRFNIQKSKVADNCTFGLKKNLEGGGEISLSYEYLKDFHVKYNGVSNADIKTGLVFVGYGIEEGENGYNDYLTGDGTEINLKDKIAVFVDSFPGQNDEDSPFSKAKKREYLSIKDKARTALAKGALGVLVVQSPIAEKMPYNQKYGRILKAFSKEYTTLHVSGRPEFPVVYLSEKAGRDIFSELAEVELEDILKGIDNTTTPSPFAIEGVTSEIKVNIDYDVLLTQNVAGYIEGTDPVLKEEVVVMGAHYDHVGLGYYGAMDKSNKGQIHNGADDNGSGTAGLIELAQAYAKNPPKRSIVFVAFGAEENGLLGSRYYVHHQPLMPLEKTVAMLNLDMISRNEPELVWIGGAFQGTDIVDDVKTANAETGMELLYNVGMLGSASDQAHFLKKDIPAVFFFSGMHDDYHMPSDDVDKVDFDKAARITKLAYLTGWLLTNQDKNPEYRDLSMPEKIKLVKESVERMKIYRNEDH